MAEAVTYADLRFVKAPLKKSISSRLGEEADEDGELTYENVQVSPGPGGPSSLASAGLGDKAGVQSEQPTAAWSPVTSPAAGRILPYFQVSQQLQQMSSVLEATNSTLRQQLRLKITELGQKEEDLQGSRRELAQSQERLQVQQKVGQATKEQLQACQSDGEQTKEALRNKEIQSVNLEQRLSSVRDTLKPFFTCPSPDSCCPLGWIPNERRCFYISVTKRSWDESQNHCKSLSSELAKISETYSYGTYIRSLRKVLAQGGSAESYWIDFRNKFWPWSDGTRYNGFYSQSQRCVKVEGERLASLKGEDCYSSLPSICEMEAFRYSRQREPVPFILKL
ncbi:B-cell differentiation antigen CD72 isoform X3 [Mesoplodon densirostris]|uniref:B-cell differentiation antigen CD72 isoform X3 n=1 Tax=Mesoplodon densirostris TaxID=48708 RepID=UPI0028DC85DD|nr:B-cell differentiation antigen CD72 isoform X3 [Mesoplodon densirostris]